MKILFINAQDIKGGAAVAAFRLSQGLEAYHETENHFIVSKKHSGESHVYSSRRNQFEVFIEIFVDKVFNKLGLQYQYLPFSPGRILKLARRLAPDIISLHNTHEGYFTTRLIRKLSRIAPIAWTLHDMWAFTGNAAHTFGDISWKTMQCSAAETKIYPHIGINTGKWLLKQKRRIYKQSDLHIITPSAWMQEQARQSPVFAGKAIHCIHHGLDLNRFCPRDRMSCRRVLGIDLSAKVLVFSSADDLDISPWKGGPLLMEILESLNRKTEYPIHLLAVGKGQLEAAQGLKNLVVHKMGFVSSEPFMTILLSAADLFIYPTRADSFGLVLAESIACGTPAVTFNVGGCGDIIKVGQSGVPVDPFDVERFTDETFKLLTEADQTAQLSRKARLFAETHFDLKQMAEKHFMLFQDIISQRTGNKKIKDL